VDTLGSSHVKLKVEDEAAVIWGFWAMRHALCLLGLVLFLSGTAKAQTSSINPLLVAVPYSISSSGAVTTAAAPASETLASTALVSAPLNTASFLPVATTANSSTPEATPADPQYVQGVFVNYNWQAYVGYTYFHFDADHGISRSQNGVNFSISYFFNNWFGVEGEFVATHDNPNNQSSWFVFGGGGPRFRWLAPKGIEVFAHGLVGYSHLTPQTPFGKQEAFAYELGGGADFPTPFRRLAIRVGADMVGTRYYNNNQFNPKAYAGIVFKF
jgi:hypothetical protein